MNLKREQVEKIMGLAIYISQNSNIDVFVNYFPHVSGLNVRIFYDGWSSDDNDNYKQYNVRSDNAVYNMTRYEEFKNEYHYADDCICELEKLAESIMVYS